MDSVDGLTVIVECHLLSELPPAIVTAKLFHVFVYLQMQRVHSPDELAADVTNRPGLIDLQIVTFDVLHKVVLP